METNAQDRKIKYVIHFAKGHYVVVDDYHIDKNGFLTGIKNGKVMVIAKSFTCITAIDSEILANMRSTVDYNVSTGFGEFPDDYSYLIFFVSPMDNYMDHVEGE